MPAWRVGLFGLTAALLAGAGELCSPAAQKPAAAGYTVDVDSSRVYVKVGSATRLGHEHGVEGKLKSGQLAFPAGGELAFDLASFTADSAEARKRVGLGKKKVSRSEARKVTDAMHGSDVLDVERSPAATFVLTSIRPLDKQDAGKPGSYQLEGRFSLHGTEKPLSFQAKLEGGDKDGRLRLSGRFTLRQSDYGIKPYSAAAGLVRVADELEITGELLLRPAKK